MAFWGEVLKPGQKKALSSKVGTGDVLHLSQACIHDPKPGKNYLQVDVKGTTYSIACLEKDKREHDCLDLFFDDSSTTFVCKGTSEIHIMGYVEPRSDDAPEDSEEEQVAQKKASPKAAPASSPKQAATSPKISPKAAAAAQAEDDEDDYEDEEEEEEPPSAPVKAASPKTSPKAQAAAAEDSEDDLDLEGEEEEESLDASLMEDEESEEDQAPPQKRKGAPEPAASPAKKGKTEPASSNGGDEQGAYVKKLVEYLKKNGKTSIGVLGSKVPRPNGVPKMKVIFEQSKDKFNVAGDQVTAK